ncbi:MAG: hypothetical protein WC516_06610 [Patescibacteria group bacterium]|jgi:hypothetical protein
MPIEDKIDAIQMIKDIAACATRQEGYEKEQVQVKADIAEIKNSRKESTKYLITTIISILAFALGALGVIQKLFEKKAP